MADADVVDRLIVYLLELPSITTRLAFTAAAVAVLATVAVSWTLWALCWVRGTLATAARFAVAPSSPPADINAAHECATLVGTGLSGATVDAIARLGASSLAQAIVLDQRYTAVQAMRAYIFLALRAHAETNCLTASMFEAALQDAALADAALAATLAAGSRSPAQILSENPLWGVPISIKEQIQIAGTRATCGLKALYLAGPHDQDGTFVEVVRATGAIPFVKTNVPMSLIASETTNHVYGTTTNPWNPRRTPGGSSGGEGALIASGGSVLGIGTDIGGSLRIPATFNGLATIKPTPCRVTRRGITRPAQTSQPFILPVAGPLARSVADAEALLGAMIDTQLMAARDPAVVPLPYNWDLAEPSIPRSPLAPTLTVGFYDDDGYFPSAPAYKRAVQMAVDGLRAAGYRVVPYKPPAIAHAINLWCAILVADRMQGFVDTADHEPFIKQYVLMMLSARANSAVRAVLTSLMSLLGLSRLQELSSVARPRSVTEFEELEKQRSAYVCEFFDGWSEQGIDAVVAPGFGVYPFPHGDSAKLNPSAASYTMLVNLLNTAGGTVPITRVRPDEMAHPDALAGLSRFDPLRAATAAAAAHSEGLPIGVQVYSRPFADELVVRVLKSIEAAIPFEDMCLLRAESATER